MERKKRIFIGSSVESKSIAEQIQKKLADEYEVILWYENFFSIGRHFYKELITKIISFDFAIMIGGVDDFVERMPEKTSAKYSPRDNVYLEYGLFSGFLSANRVLLLINKQCTAASDLSGMSLAVFSSEGDAVGIAESWVASYPERRKQFPDSNVELLPIYGIAVGYYYNFIEPFIKALSAAKKESITYNALFSTDEKTSLKEDIVYDKIRLNICIPNYIIRDPKEYKELFYQSQNIKTRFVSVYRIDADPQSTGNVLQLYDVPSTLLALFKTVDTVFGIIDEDTDDSICAKQRALESFGGILINLIAQNRYVSLNSDNKKLSVYITWFSDSTE